MEPPPNSMPYTRHYYIYLYIYIIYWPILAIQKQKKKLIILKTCRNLDFLCLVLGTFKIIIWCALLGCGLDGRLNTLSVLLDQTLPLRDQAMRRGRLLRRKITELGQRHGRTHARIGTGCAQNMATAATIR